MRKIAQQDRDTILLHDGSAVLYEFLAIMSMRAVALDLFACPTREYIYPIFVDNTRFGIRNHSS